MSNSFNPFTLEDKKILITGASSGIGKAIAIACSKLGALVIISGRNEDKLQDTFSLLEGESNIKVTADLTSEDGIEAIVSNVPQLNGIVHCAGVGGRSLLKMIREKEIERIMRSNFNAPVLLQRALLKKKKVANGASIVLMGSRAPYAPATGTGIYAASKAALISYGKSLGLELAPMGIRVNSICPAMVKTDMVVMDAELSEINLDLVAAKYPLKRLGTPEDVAYLTVYLLSDASSWMSGSCIDITGGGEFTLA